MSKVQITEDNFSEYFFPANEKYKPNKGQILTRWRAAGDLVDGWIKRQIIQMLGTNAAGAVTARKVMKKLVCAQDRDCVRILREMAEDMNNGMTEDQVAEKPYRFVLEQFYWTDKELVPDDPHWEIINITDVRGA